MSDSQPTSERSKNPFDDTDDYGSADSRSEMEQVCCVQMPFLTRHKNTDFDVTELDGESDEEEGKGKGSLPHFDLPELDDRELSLFFEHPMIKTAFAEGVGTKALWLLLIYVDLKEHRQSIYNQLLTAEQETLKLYREERENITQLFQHLNTCDEVLGGLDTCISSFEQSLSDRITEIHEMQKEAKMKMVRMQNHQKISEELSKFLNEVYLPENLTRAIARGKINQSYVQYLDAFSSKISFIESMPLFFFIETHVIQGISMNDVLAVKEQKQAVKELVTKACEKIHKWLLSKTTNKIKSVPTLKKRQPPLLKYNLLFHFLLRHSPKNADEVASKYVEVVTKIYAAHFRHHLEQISKLCLEIADKNDTLGEPEHTTWSFFTSKILQMKKKTPIYALTQRYFFFFHYLTPFQTIYHK